MTSKATRRRHWLRRMAPRGPRLHRQHQKHIPHHIEGEVGDVELAAGDVDLRELVDERACHTEEDRPPRRMPRDPCAEEKPCAQPEKPIFHRVRELPECDIIMPRVHRAAIHELVDRIRHPDDPIRERCRIRPRLK